MKMSERRKLMLRALMRAALPAVEALPPGERADAYEGIAIACARYDAELHDTAHQAAEHLRESLGAQMSFRQLLK